MEINHLILGKANPQRMNGVNRVVNELATRQAAQGIKVKVYGLAQNAIADYPSRNYITCLFKKHRNPFTLPTSFINTIRGLNPQDTVFHLHGGFIPQMYAAARLLHRHHIPFVFTPHGSYNSIAMQRNGAIKSIYYRLFERRLLELSAGIHLLGQSELTATQKLVPRANLHLIPYGFEISELKTRALDPDKLIIGYCGRIDIYTKGLKELLMGFDKFYQYNKNARLWIIGDGKEKTALQRLAETLVCYKAITFWNARYGNEKESLLRQCSIFAAPSRNEGMPNSVLEAASMGIPCLVTVATNTGDYILKYKAGEVIPDTSPEEVFFGLTKLSEKIKDPLSAHSISERARLMIRESFDWQHILSRFNQLYQC